MGSIKFKITLFHFPLDCFTSIFSQSLLSTGYIPYACEKVNDANRNSRQKNESNKRNFQSEQQPERTRVSMVKHWMANTRSIETELKTIRNQTNRNTTNQQHTGPETHTTTTTKPPITVICVLTPAAVFHGRMISLTQHTPAVDAGPGGKKVKFQLAFEITKTLTASPDSVRWHRCRALLSTRCPRHGGGRGGWMSEVFLLNHLPLTKQSSVNRAKNKELKCCVESSALSECLFPFQPY